MMTEERRLLRAEMRTRRKVDDLVLPEVGVDAIGPHLALPALRAFWPMSMVDYQRPECTDISGHGYDLQSANALGDVLFGYDANQLLAPIAQFQGGANQYLTRADGGAGNWADILGTEAYIIAAQRGLTLGGWFWWTTLPGVQEFLLSKDDGGANRQYRVELGGYAANQPSFGVWPGPVSALHTTTISTGWNHIVGLYDQANQDLHIALNGVIITNAGAPAALADTGAAFVIGANSAGVGRFTGYASMCFLCACFVPTAIIQALYQQTRSLFGM